MTAQRMVVDLEGISEGEDRGQREDDRESALQRAAGADQSFDQESENNLSWCDEKPAKENQPVSKSYNF